MVYQNNYGVNVHGFPAEADQEIIVSKYQREIVRQEAVEQVASSRESMRTYLKNSITKHGPGLIRIIFALAIPDQPANGEAVNDTVEALIDDFETVVSGTEICLRWALLANVMADTDRYDANNQDHMKELGLIYKDFLTMEMIPSDNSDAITIQSLAEPYEELYDAIIIWQAALKMIQEAQEQISLGNHLIAGYKIIEEDHTFLACGTENPIVFTIFEDGFYSNLEEGILEDYLYFVAGDDLSKSGFFPAMASILGDFAAPMVAYVDNEDAIVYDVAGEGRETFIYNSRSTAEYGDNPLQPEDRYNEETNKGVLWNVYEEANAVYAEGEIPMTTTRGDVTAYGYSVDLAFRSSENGNLALQQEGSSRVANPYDDPNNLNQNLQGSGSMVSFDIFGNMTVDQIKRLLESLYVVFMDTDSGAIHGVARVDPDDLVYQGVSVTAPLTMYSVDRDAMQDEDAEPGVLILGDPIKNNVITSLTANEIEWITAIVYLNGDTVSSADVSAVGQMSLIGSINLQFALDGVTLEAMRYDDYYVAPTETENQGG